MVSCEEKDIMDDEWKDCIHSLDGHSNGKFLRILVEMMKMSRLQIVLNLFYSYYTLRLHNDTDVGEVKSNFRIPE